MVERHLVKHHGA